MLRRAAVGTLLFSTAAAIDAALEKLTDDLQASWKIDDIPSPSCDGYVYADDWDYQDYAYESDNAFVRLVWATTG